MNSARRILVILGHPNSNSLCHHLAEVYTESAREAGFEVQTLRLNELNFDPILHYNYKEKEKQSLEPDLLKSQKLITDSEHLVFFFPSWWASMPALLKGWIDRVFLPGFAFQYQKDSPFPLQLLKGKSARIIITMDAPTWYYHWFNGAPGLKLLKKGTLEFCGIKPVKYTLLGLIRSASKEKIQSYFKQVEDLGKKGI